MGVESAAALLDDLTAEERKDVFLGLAALALELARELVLICPEPFHAEQVVLLEELVRRHRDLARGSADG